MEAIILDFYKEQVKTNKEIEELNHKLKSLTEVLINILQRPVSMTEEQADAIAQILASRVEGLLKVQDKKVRPIVN